MSCPADTEDRVITFYNSTKERITIVTDVGTVVLNGLTNQADDETTGTVTKKGSDIEIIEVTYPSYIDPEVDIDITGSVTLGRGKKKGGVYLGSGVMYFSYMSGSRYGWTTKISVIAE